MVWRCVCAPRCNPPHLSCILGALECLQDLAHGRKTGGRLPRCSLVAATQQQHLQRKLQHALEGQEVVRIRMASVVVVLQQIMRTAGENRALLDCRSEGQALGRLSDVVIELPAGQGLPIQTKRTRTPSSRAVLSLPTHHFGAFLANPTLRSFPCQPITLELSLPTHHFGR